MSGNCTIEDNRNVPVSDDSTMEKRDQSDRNEKDALIEEFKVELQIEDTDVGSLKSKKLRDLIKLNKKNWRSPIGQVLKRFWAKDFVVMDCDWVITKDIIKKL